MFFSTSNSLLEGVTSLFTVNILHRLLNGVFLKLFICDIFLKKNQINLFLKFAMANIKLIRWLFLLFCMWLIRLNEPLYQMGPSIELYIEEFIKWSVLCNTFYNIIAFSFYIILIDSDSAAQTSKITLTIEAKLS